MPCNGKVTEVNEELEDQPQKVSIGAETEGWLLKFSMDSDADLGELMDEEAYHKYLDTIDEDE